MYKFTSNTHGDIGLINGEESNLGYNHVLKLPIMFWLHNLQTGNENIFGCTEGPTSLEGDCEARNIEKLIEEAEELRGKLPLSIEDFNTESFLGGFSRFSDGYHRISYEFTLQEDQRLCLKKSSRGSTTSEQVLSLNPAESKILTFDYLKFLEGEPRLETVSNRVKYIANELGKV